jgi:hypothetical protein
MRHVTIYRDPDRYAGWPANYGIWIWDADPDAAGTGAADDSVGDQIVSDEIVVAFTVGYPDPGGGFHRRDRNRPFVTMQARSLDGGLTWQVDECPCRTPGRRGLSADEHVAHDLSAAQAIEQGLENTPGDCPGGIDFTHADFAIMCARTGLGAGTRAWFYTSTDRCHTWDGPWALPMFGQAGVEARTDYTVSGPGECTLFLTASKASGGEGDHIFCVRTTDGGRTFCYLAPVTPRFEEPAFAIMPSSVRLSPSLLLTAVRCRGGNGEFARALHWIDLYASDDDGATWRYLNRPVPDTGSGGNPPAMIRLHDGRVCLTYGVRAAPYGIRARLSADGGETWGDEIVLRDDGGNHDLGYPRTVQRSDGTIVTAYYTNDRPDGERYIAATLWRA